MTPRRAFRLPSSQTHDQREIAEEIAFHIDEKTKRLIAQGMSAEEARREAERSFGDIERLTAAMTRQGRGRRVHEKVSSWLDGTYRDVRHAIRALRGTPGFTTVALTVLALGIGALTAIFSVVDAVVFRHLPYDEGERLAAVGEVNLSDPSDRTPLVAPQNFLDWRVQQDVFTDLAALWDNEISLRPREAGPVEVLHAQNVTASYFALLRVEPLLGRNFSDENEVDGRDGVAVISHGLWQRRFGGSTDVIGQELAGPLATWEIVGVMPADFVRPLGEPSPVDVWLPYAPTADDRVRGNRYGYNLRVIGRLDEGVSIDGAQRRMREINRGLSLQYPTWFEDRDVIVQSLQENISGPVRAWMLLLLGAVVFVQLIVCANIGNLMLVRGTTRLRELQVRAALGASRSRLARMLLVESLVLSIVGAALGIVIAYWGVQVLRSYLPSDLPRLADVGVNSRVLATSAIAALATGVVFGFFPLARVRHGAGRTLPDDSRGSTEGKGTHRLRAVFVSVEVALTVILLVGAGLFLASFARVTGVDLGFDHRDVMTAQIRVLEQPADVHAAAQRNRRLLIDALERARTIPGVERASLLGMGLPLRGDLRTVRFAIPGRELPRNTDIALYQISSDYFRTLSVPLLQGREFSTADREDTEGVVILNATAATLYFADENPMGRTVEVQGERTVVGVVGNIRQDGPEGEWRAQAFVPITQSPVLGATLLARTSPGTGAAAAALREAIGTAFGSSDLLVRVDVESLSSYWNVLIGQRRSSMLLIAIFGILGVVVASVGIYGVTAYAIVQRTREIGVRVALGGTSGSVAATVAGAASAYVLVGLAVGLVGSWFLAKLIEGFLFQVGPHEAGVYAAAAAALLVAATAAVYVPARRAARLDPVTALRSE